MHNHADDGSRSASSSIIKPLIQPSAHEDSRELEGDAEHPAPRKVQHSKAALVLDLAFDAVLLAVGLGFLALAIASSSFNGKPVHENQEVADMLQSAASIGPTLLPIIFAVILGRTCKSILIWRLERGERIGTLDLLAGSTSLASTLLTHLTLRSFITWVSPLLLVIWVLSPIGSQASLRVITTEMFNQSASFNYSYLVQDSLYSSLFWFAYDDNGSAHALDTMFSSALLAPTEIKNSPRDLWFNVKSPMIEEFEHNAPNDGDWYEIGSADTIVYSSLIGTPIANISSEVPYASMNVETSYWRLICEPLFDHMPNSAELNSAWQRLNCDHSDSRQFPELERCLSFTQSIQGEEKPGEKGFAACSIGTTYVELDVECEGRLCATTRVRRSRSLGNPAASWTWIDEYSGGINNFTHLQYIFPFGKRFTGRYIVNPDTTASFPSTILHEVPSDIFAVRYGQLLNSAWASLGNLLGMSDFSNQAATTTGSNTASTEVLRCHRTWMWILVATSLIMIMATLLHATLLSITRAPRQLNINVSSLIQDNRYVLFPMTGSAADASERARRVKNCYVRYGDVQPDEEVGHLAIGSVDEQSPKEEGGKVERVRRDRYYD